MITLSGCLQSASFDVFPSGVLEESVLLVYNDVSSDNLVP
jgi:hypothetical protein